MSSCLWKLLPVHLPNWAHVDSHVYCRPLLCYMTVTFRKQLLLDLCLLTETGSASSQASLIHSSGQMYSWSMINEEMNTSNHQYNTAQAFHFVWCWNFINCAVYDAAWIELAKKNLLFFILFHFCGTTMSFNVKKNSPWKLNPLSFLLQHLTISYEVKVKVLLKCRKMSEDVGKEDMPH